MKRFAALLLLVLCAPAALGSVVVHDGREGIVAMEDNGYCLDSDGQVWGLTNGGAGGWVREGLELYDPPVPVAEIKFWAYNKFVTVDDEGWLFMGPGVWQCFGRWPASSVPAPESWTATAAVSPNPAAGSCRVSLNLEAPGPAAVRVFDATGRQVRALVEAELPAGAVSVTWDGRDDFGRPAPAGIYFARVETAAGAQAVRVVLAR